MSDRIEFRFGPRARWEPVPAGYTVEQAILLYGANYQLRINGEVREADARTDTQGGSYG